MKRTILLLMVAALALGSAGCRVVEISKAAASSKPRITNPEYAAIVPEATAGNTAFAFDLYQVLRRAGGNLFYSPFSISLALAMTYAGARGDTQLQMAEALHFTLESADLHRAFNGLDLLLATRGKQAAGKDGKGFRLNVVNAAWGQRGYDFLSTYLDTLAENYGAGVRLLDFVAAPEPSRVEINDWVAEQTEGRIEDLIQPGLIDRLTRLVLTNAVYFNAAWMYPFDSEATVEAPFHRYDGSDAQVQMMTMAEGLGYAAGQGYQAVELPYDGGELSMVILLPDSGQLDEFEATLDSTRAAAIIDQLATSQVRLSMPKFEFRSEFGLSDALSELGMPVAFSGDADFSGMTGSRELAISEVVHQAFVAVDEAGTEAAAATAVIMRLTSVMQDQVELTVDRPFIFLIRDLETGTVLFVGRYLG